jgi:SAM-dependent methyltransferase
MITSDPGSLDRYFEVVAQMGQVPGNWRFRLKYLFGRIDFRGKAVLDVGGGDGLLSFYAACAGAANVVCLEPAKAGSAPDTIDAFDRAASLLDEVKVQWIPQRFQEYECGDSVFDVLLLHASINHLDEDACVRLHHDRAAQSLYGRSFRKLARLARPGAKLIIVDCARRNLFADLRMRNPLEPTIEWHKHQSPKLWARLLTRAGFVNPVIRWNSFNTLRSYGRLFLGNRLAAYCLTSTFCLTMERQWGESSRPAVA